MALTIVDQEAIQAHARPKGDKDLEVILRIPAAAEVQTAVRVDQEKEEKGQKGEKEDTPVTEWTAQGGAAAHHPEDREDRWIGLQKTQNYLSRTLMDRYLENNHRFLKKKCEKTLKNSLQLLEKSGKLL